MAETAGNGVQTTGRGVTGRSKCGAAEKEAILSGHHDIRHAKRARVIATTYLLTNSLCQRIIQ